MFFRIIKKDLKRKKTMNLILFLFILLATMFLASSTKNMSTILHAIDYFSTETKTTDFFEISKDKEKLIEIIEDCPVNESYEIQTMIALEKDNVKSNGIKLEGAGQSLITRTDAKTNIVVDDDNEPVRHIEKGEIGICIYLADENDLKIGDEISLTIGEVTKTLRISTIYKDFVFGSPYIFAKRFVVSDEDFNELYDNAKNYITYCAMINTSDVDATVESFTNAGVESYFSFSKSDLESTFLMELMILGMLIAVSVFLILISFVVLRFIILFTIQEDYREIGIMKAIGLRNGNIKKIYMVKYLFLAITGSFFGVIASFGFGDLLLSQMTKTMVLEKNNSQWWIEIICGLFIIIVVFLYCLLCTNKLKKFSAMKAIRSGESGERFKKKSPIALHGRKKMSIQTYLAFNDILSSPKRYISLLIVFMFGIMLINITDNSANTLGDGTIGVQLGYKKSDFAIQTDRMSSYLGDKETDMRKELDHIEKIYEDQGINVNLFIDYMIQVNASSTQSEKSKQVYVNCHLNSDAIGYSYMEGVAPVLANECAVTQKLMDQLNLSIGDFIELRINGESNSYLITASYQTMSNMGLGIIVSDKAPLDFSKVSFIGYIQGNFTDNVDIEKTIEEMNIITPNYEVFTFAGLSKKELGTVADTIWTVKDFLIGIAVILNILISILMVKTFLTKDRPDIALAMSLGIKVRTLRKWQTLRISIIFVISMILGCFASFLADPICAKFTFGMMGATNIELIRDPLRVYLIYPVSLAAINTIITYVLTRSVKHVDFKEINSME